MNCTLLCVLLKYSRRIIVCEKSPERIRFVREYYSDALVTEPEVCRDFALHHSDRGRADAALEAAGAVDTLRLPWECVRPKVVVTAVAFYDRPQTLLLADMYGKNLTWKSGGVDACKDAYLVQLISEGKLDPTPLFNKEYTLNEIAQVYEDFAVKRDGLIKPVIKPYEY